MSDSQHRSYIKYSWFLLGMVFLVILAGGVVRMTQSGMGCPDWPRCFGMWIPPTDASQLPVDFEKYLSKQDIDHSFNVYHTWIEYINRLLGALLGVFIFIYAVWTSLKFSTNRSVLKNLLFCDLGLALGVVLSIMLGYAPLTYLMMFAFIGTALFSLYHAVRHCDRRALTVVSILLLIAVAVQGWLGKIVVDENLSVVKITIHMIGALVIAALPLINISRIRNYRVDVTPFIKHTLTGMVLVLLLQIVLGTQVREEIDEISKALSYGQRELWIERLGVIFIIHRSFSWIVLAGALALLYKGRQVAKFSMMSKFLIGVVTWVILLGIIMAYLDMPALAQPLHLLFACVLLMQLFYYRLIVK